MRAALKLQSGVFSTETNADFDFYAPLSIGYPGDFGFYVNNNPTASAFVADYKLLGSGDNLTTAVTTNKEVTAFLDYNYL